MEGQTPILGTGRRGYVSSQGQVRPGKQLLTVSLRYRMRTRASGMLYEWLKRMLRNKVGSKYVEEDDVLSVVSVASNFAANSTTAILQESGRPTAHRAKNSTEATTISTSALKEHERAVADSIESENSSDKYRSALEEHEHTEAESIEKETSSDEYHPLERAWTKEEVLNLSSVKLRTNNK